MHYDSYALIVNGDGDGGDTCQREGMYGFLTAIRVPLDTWLEIKPGVYVRHPDPQQWWSNPKTTSRDQLSPIIWYCAVTKDYSRLGRLFKACLKRGMFAQNTEEKDGTRKLPDTMVGNIADFIRAFGSDITHPLYFLLLGLDFASLVAQIAWLLTPRSLDDVDDNNRVLGHIGAAMFVPTPFSWLSRKLYARFRPTSFGSSTEPNRVLAALTWYHRGPNGNPEFVELFRPFINKYF